MTNRYFLNKLKTSILALLCIVFVLSMSLFTLTACNDDDETEDPTYSYTDVDEGLISNADFTKNTANKAKDAYPIASASDWTKAYHKQSISSYVDSGVIDVSSNADKTYPWDETVKKLKEDNDLLTALAYQYYPTDVTSTETAKAKYDTIKNDFESKYFPNPGTHDGAVDGKMYMLNNYPQNQKYIGKGTAQSLTSSKSISLEKNKVAKITVWVKTANITGHGDPANRGANISLTNSISGKTQSQFRVTSIIANEWTEYVLYVQGDSIYDSSLTLVLGLGFGLGSNVQTKYYTQGTAYFDDITCEILDEMPSDVTFDVTKNLDVASEEPFDINAYNLNNGFKKTVDNKEEYISASETKKTFCYDMTILNANNQVVELVGLDDAKPTDYFTTSNVKNKDGEFTTSKDIAQNSTITMTEITDGQVFDLVEASASIKTASFTLARGEYALVNFSIINALKVIGSTDISVDVWDICEKNGVKSTKKIASVLASDEVSEDAVNQSFLIYNNFPTGDDGVDFENETRSFYVVLNIGPNDLSPILLATDLATGKVTVKDFTVVTAVTPEDGDDGYKGYEFITSTTSVSKYLTAGYDGFSADTGYTETAETTNTYTLQTRPSDLGNIKDAPANVKGYEGVTSEHSYVKENGIETALNNRSGKNGKNGSYAGLINSEYIDNYATLTSGTAGTTLSDIKTALGTVTPGAKIQPLMIYNHDADSYGYVGEKITVEANDFALITLKVRVTGNAKAYIYLVDCSQIEKEVLTFDSFTPTTSVSNKVQGTLDSTNNKFEFVVSSTADEWQTISFYIATGATEKVFRLEMWNGSRDGAQKSQGYVFFDNINSTTTGAFTESDKWENVANGHPLYDTFNKTLAQTDVVVTYTQQLTELEQEFNEEYKDNADIAQVKYYENYVWVKTSNLLYAVLNTIDPEITDPYDSLPEEDEEDAESGCTAETDPSTFWLSFSSILLGVCLVLAIIALILKFYLRKRKANRSDAVVHYNVTSRIRSKRDVVKEDAEEETEESVEEAETTEEQVEETTEEATEQTLDEYVYGEVIEDFSEETQENNEEQANENNDDSSNQ